jgi:hypothetical protein
MFLPNGDSFTGEWRRGLIGGMLLCVEAVFLLDVQCLGVLSCRG